MPLFRLMFADLARGETTVCKSHSLPAQLKFSETAAAVKFSDAVTFVLALVI